MIFPEYVSSLRESYERELARERKDNARLLAKLEAAHYEIGVLKWKLANGEKAA